VQLAPEFVTRNNEENQFPIKAQSQLAGFTGIIRASSAAFERIFFPSSSAEDLPRKQYDP
jgi:hypothetical protein